MPSQWAGGRGLRWNLQQTLTPAILGQLGDAHKVPPPRPGAGGSPYRETLGRSWPWAGGSAPQRASHSGQEQENPLQFWGD